ncbi:MAG: aspartate-semialdehyde dehydrogenase, partial [Burkholderiales bacterium]
MRKKYDVCVLGVTGAVGEAMISILEERDFPVGKIYPLASSRSAGTTVKFRGRDVEVEDVSDFDFSKAQIG